MAYKQVSVMKPSFKLIFVIAKGRSYIKNNTGKKNNNIHKKEVQEIRCSDENLKMQSSCKYQNIYYIKINLPENHYSKIYEDKAIISC